MHYTFKDLTVIIPTIGRDITLLEKVLESVQAEQTGIDIIVVWDGFTAPTPELKARLSAQKNLSLVVHSQNRGLSAARNTGVTHLTTPLGMFIDDDIIPQKHFIQPVLDFHNSNPGQYQAVMGKVTWEGGAFESPLTRWYEEAGGWSIFHTTADGARFSVFMGGFTSFKADALRAIKFEEKFKKYGCEDIEFGVRFFGSGGELIYKPDVVGIHLKPLTVESYTAEMRAAGYSRALLSILQPDDYFDFSYFKLALGQQYDEAYFSHFVQFLNTLQSQSGNRDEYHTLVNMLSNNAMAEGYRRYFSTHFASVTRCVSTGIENARDARELLSLPPAAMGYSTEHNYVLSRHDLQYLQSIMPHYFAPYLAEYLLGEDSCVLDRFASANAGKVLSAQVKAKVNRLTGNKENQIVSRTSRELFRELQNKQALMPADIVIAGDILRQDTTYAGVYVKLAGYYLDKDPTLADIFCTVARFFAQRRPKAESDIHLQNIRKVEAALKEEDPCQKF